jgi:GNAT superfamily N-acetyltransferase
MVRFADESDLSFVAQDGYVSRDIIARKIDAGEVLIAEKNTIPVGYLRIEYLWSKLPYITIIRVLPDHRKEGVGKALLAFLECELARAGHSILLSSSQADEPEPQSWHRHVGFTECGRLAKINDGVDEVFFRKRLSPGPSNRALS